MPITPHTFAMFQARVSGAPGPKKRNKYNARKVEYDGYVFDSTVEMKRYKELRLLEKAGRIHDLLVHPPYQLVINGHKIGRYTADFEYWEKNGEQVGEYHVVEDCKSTFTRKNREYRRNLKLMLAIYNVTIREIIR